MKHYHITTFFRIIRIGFVNITRNLWLTIAATAVMVVTLTIVSVGVVMNATASNAIDVLSRDLKTTIYLKDTVTIDQRSELEKSIRGLDFVAGLEYISPSEAQKRLIKDPSIGEEVIQATALFEGQDFLQPSFEVSLNDLSRANELLSVVSSDKFKDITDRVSLGKTDTGVQTDSEKAIDRAAAMEHFITVGSIISAGTLSLISIMIIFNTIRMAIYTRREEIGVMKLIGATPSYIRGPFLVEASIYGVVAGIMSSSLVYTLVYALGSKVADTPEFSQTYSYFTQTSTILLMVASAVTLGLLLGIVSSTLAMEKHLKLKHW